MTNLQFAILLGFIVATPVVMTTAFVAGWFIGERWSRGRRVVP